MAGFVMEQKKTKNISIEHEAGKSNQNSIWQKRPFRINTLEFECDMNFLMPY
jgi:hypothetical protein